MLVWYGAEKQRAFHTIQEYVKVILERVMGFYSLLALSI
jgi:hypothetical protein